MTSGSTVSTLYGYLRASRAGAVAAGVAVTGRSVGVTPWCASASFEVPLTVPRVDDRVVGLLLDARGIQIVCDHVVSEDLPRRSGPLQFRDRLIECARHAGMAGRQ